MEVKTKAIKTNEKQIKPMLQFTKCFKTNDIPNKTKRNDEEQTMGYNH